MAKRAIDFGEASRERFGAAELAATAEVIAFRKEPHSGEFGQPVGEAEARAQAGHFTSLRNYATLWRQKLNLSQEIEVALTTFWNNSINQPVGAANFTVRPADGGFQVRSQNGVMPINEKALNRFYKAVGEPDPKNFTQSYALEAISMVLVIAAAAVRLSGARMSIDQLQSVSISFQNSSAKLQAFALLAEESDQLVPELTTAQATIENIDAMLKQRNEELQTMNSSLDALVVRNEQAMKYGDLFVERIKEIEGRHEAFIDALRTEANFDGLKTHWLDRAKTARWAFVISCGVLFLLLVVLPICGIYYHTAIIGFMKELGDAATADLGKEPATVAITVATVTRLLVVTIPIVLYFWLIRLVVRFNLRSLVLMDDANSRATMLETYYRMIEKEAATVEDRALVLQALMRPTPGHGGDSVDPPTFTDVIEKAMGRGVAH